jgi:Transcriptional regulator, contains sigma factor-related N-terminal domain
MNDDIDLIIKIAKHYYEDGKTQQEIADEIGMTRAQIIQQLKMREKWYSPD